MLFRSQIVDENLRTATGSYGHYQPIYYYLPVFLENSLPWSFFIPAIALFIYHRRRRLEEERLLFHLVWLFSVLIFFSASLGKRGVYILPVYPAFALLCGAWWQRLGENTSRDVSVARWLAYAFTAVSIAATLAAIFGLASYYAAQNGVIDPGHLVFLTRSNKVARALALLSGTPALTGVCFVLLLAALSALGWALFRRSWLFTFAAISLTSLVVSTIIKNTFFPSLASELTLKPFMIIAVRQRKCALAQALIITRSGRATTNPASRTSKPKMTTDMRTNANPLKVNPPIGVPGATKDRITEIAPITASTAPRILGKYAGPILKAVPML